MELTELMSVSTLWSIIGFLTVLQRFIPHEVYNYIAEVRDDLRKRFFQRYAPFYTVQVNAHQEFGSNSLYTYVDRYLGAQAAQAEMVSASAIAGSTDIHLAVSNGQLLQDVFQGVAFSWRYTEAKEDSRRGEWEHSYTLRVGSEHKHLVDKYLKFILSSGIATSHKQRDKRLLTNSHGHWMPITFRPPATFDTVAMESAKKEELKRDLVAFMKGQEYYRSVGRAWKRGYLLYGPPGTGKSSLIAAIANFTSFDVYDLELTKVLSNTELRRLLTQVGDRSIVVVEDIDCSANFAKRSTRSPSSKEKKDVTLSGLLNCTDGLWSSCSKEVIFIFTTNHVDRIDAALLRPGRMDVHICMSYCNSEMFRTLAQSYLRVTEHPLLTEVDELLASVNITPAALIEVMLGNCTQPDDALRQLVEHLRNKLNSPEEEEDTKQQDMPDEEEEKEAEADDRDDESGEDDLYSVPDLI